MAREFQLSTKERGHYGATELDFGSLDQSFFPQLPLTTPSVNGDMYSQSQYFDHGLAQNSIDHCGLTNNVNDSGMMNFLNDQEWNLSQNTLYGLFAPTQSFQ
jgi:hypothetical protein